MEERGTKEQVLGGLFWKVMENGGSQGIQFVISFILARLLSPGEYGIIYIALILVTTAKVNGQHGFGMALGLCLIYIFQPTRRYVILHAGF